MMKKAIVALSVVTLPLLAQALPEKGNINRFGVATSTWQEPLRLQSATGQVDVSVANYKGYFISYERQKRTKGGGYGVVVAAGTGSASGGGTGEIAYKQGGVNWTTLQIQPRAIWALSEQVDASLGVAGAYRSATWPEMTGIKVTPTSQINAAFFTDLDLMLTEKLAFRQTFGVGSLEAGLFMRWGLSYDL